MKVTPAVRRDSQTMGGSRSSMVSCWPIRTPASPGSLDGRVGAGPESDRYDLSVQWSTAWPISPPMAAPRPAPTPGMALPMTAPAAAPQPVQKPPLFE